jgi:hypothetical protein
VLHLQIAIQHLHIRFQIRRHSFQFLPFQIEFCNAKLAIDLTPFVGQFFPLVFQLPHCVFRIIPFHSHLLYGSSFEECLKLSILVFAMRISADIDFQKFRGTNGSSVEQILQLFTK